MKNLTLKAILSPILAITFASGLVAPSVYANTKQNLQNELDKEIEQALSNSGSTTTTRRVVRRTTSPKVKNFNQRSIHNFKDSTDNISRIKSEVGTSNRSSSYEEMINSTTTSLRADEPVYTLKPKKLGLNVYTYYSGAEKLTTTGNSAKNNQNQFSQYYSTASANGEYGTTGSYGFGLEYSKTSNIFASNTGLGFAVGLTYEADREIERGYVDLQGRSVSFTNPSLSMVLPYGNLLINYNNAYALLGLNYSIPQMTDANDEIYEGGLGYQLGVGMEIGNYVSIEATYRWISFTASTRISSNQFSMFQQSHERSGLGLLADEDFTLDGLNVVLKARF